jgi:hypothetical protein
MAISLFDVDTLTGNNVHVSGATFLRTLLLAVWKTGNSENVTRESSDYDVVTTRKKKAKGSSNDVHIRTIYSDR